MAAPLRHAQNKHGASLPRSPSPKMAAPLRHAQNKHGGRPAPVALLLLPRRMRRGGCPCPKWRRRRLNAATRGGALKRRRRLKGAARGGAAPLQDGAGERGAGRRARRRGGPRLLPAPRRPPRPAGAAGPRRPGLGHRGPPGARHRRAARHHHAGLQVRPRRGGGGGLAGHGGRLHRLADGAEGDRDQRLAAGHHGGRRRRLRLLAAAAGPAVPRLRAAQQGAHLGGRRLQAAGQHGLPVQGAGPQHGHHDLRLGQARARAVLRGQRGHAGAGPGLRRGLGGRLRLRGAGPRLWGGAGPRGGRRAGPPRRLPGRPPRRLLGRPRRRLPRGAGRLAARLRRQRGRPPGGLRRPGGPRLSRDAGAPVTPGPRR